MRTRFNMLVIALCVWATSRTFGHDVPVHQRITENASDLARDRSTGYKEFLDMISIEFDPADARKFLSEGSAREDDIDKDAGGKRSMNHFYDPLTRVGLSNVPIDDRVTPMGTNSFDWASLLYCHGVPFYGIAGLKSNLHTHNDWSWQSARLYEWQGLTAETPSDRQTALTNMFRAVGQVIHLLEDTSQPQHVRNEQHLDEFWKGFNTPWRSPIEDYGKTNVDSLNYEASMLDWRAAGFAKLEDFWNGRKYDGQSSSALVADAGATSDSAARLGLAEFSNGNFLGARHQFPEYFNPGSVQYYPFPSRDTSTDYNQVRANPSSGIDNFTLENGQQGRGIYLHKNADGIDIPHLVRINYLGAKIRGLTGVPYSTIKDANVLHDYHDKLIPKAVSYSAGLLDYFFRGRLSVTASGSTTAGNITLQIQNLSGQAFQGGTFRLYSDDGATPPNRSEVASFTTAYSGSLADQATTTGEFGHVNGAANYLLVYQGSIGTTDPVDAGIAIAAASFTPPAAPDWNNIVWDFIDATGIGSCSASFNHDLNDTTFGASVTVPASAPITDGAAVVVHGSLLFSGALTHCTITFNRTTDPGFGPQSFSQVRIAQTIGQDAVDVFAVNISDIPQGLSEWPFVIQAGVNSMIQIGGRTSDFNDPNNDEGEILNGTPSWDTGTDSFTATISNL